MKRALITGITGQDGSYLAELLLSKNYEVHGLIRRNSTLSRPRIDHLRVAEWRDRQWADGLFLHYGDLCDSMSLVRVLQDVQPDEIYNLAAQSHVQISFETPEYTADCTGLGVARLLEAIRSTGLIKKTRLYQASSSEMYGNVKACPQTENTPFWPRSPYACAKAFAHYLTVNYREAYGLFACCGILFNHESPRRGENFVTRKISKGVASIKAGITDKLVLGNLDAKRDWGFAKEYVEAMWRMLQADTPDDYVIATNETHTVRDFVEVSFSHVNLDYHDHLVTSAFYTRPAEVDLLIGDYSKAQEQLGWEPHTQMDALARLMTDCDYQTLQGAMRT